jgi:ATP-dependent protease ClpP protease subunit
MPRAKATIKIDKAKDPVSHLHDNHIDLQNNHVYLFPWDALAATATYGEGEPGVDYTMANRFIMNARLAMLTNPDKPMIVHQKTCGGDWGEGMAIFDTLMMHPTETTILSYTHARSMSSLTFQAATKRVMMPHSVFMFHDGTYYSEGTLKVVVSGLDFYVKVGTAMLDIYAIRMKQRGKYKSWSFKRIRDMLSTEMDKKEDVYLTAKETIEWGLADEIFYGDWSGLATYTKEQIGRRKEFAANLYNR